MSTLDVFLYAWPFRGKRQTLHFVPWENLREGCPHAVCGKQMDHRAMTQRASEVPKGLLPCPECVEGVNERRAQPPALSPTQEHP